MTIANRIDELMRTRINAAVMNVAWAPRGMDGNVLNSSPLSAKHGFTPLQETEGRCLYCNGDADSPLHCVPLLRVPPPLQRAERIVFTAQSPGLITEGVIGDLIMRLYPGDTLVSVKCEYGEWEVGRFGVPETLATMGRWSIETTPLCEIYVASKVAYAGMWRERRERLGDVIISSWIDEDDAGAMKDFADLWQRCVAEASRADVLILYHDVGDTPLKGALVEVGCALAMGRHVIVITNLSGSSIGNALGSWVAHPCVRYAASVDAAFKLARELACAR